MNKYRLDSGLINYKDFIETIDQVFTEKGIEKTPLYNV
jgi:hypothetical protein